MITRKIRREDVDDAVNFAAQVHGETYKDGEAPELNLLDLQMEIVLSIDSDRSTIYLAEERGKIIGMAWLILVDYWYNKNKKKLLERIWHADKDLSLIKKGRVVLELLKTIEKHATDVGIEQNSICLAAPINTSLSRYLKSKGYKEVEFYLKKGG